MWRIIFISLAVYILGVAAKPTEPLEGPLWLDRFFDPHADDVQIASAGSPALDSDSSSTSIGFSSADMAASDGGGPHRTTNDDLARIFRQRNLLRHVFSSADPVAEDYNVVLLRPPSEKRALSMFARWGSLGNLPNERASIRNNAFRLDSKQTRARMAGQPLRWG